MDKILNLDLQLVDSTNVTDHTDDDSFVWVKEFRMVGDIMATAKPTNADSPRFTANDFVVVHTDKVDRNALPEAQSFLNRLVDNGYEYNGRKFIPAFIGASQARQACFTLIAEEKRADFLKWARLGLPAERYAKIPSNKQAKYLGLSFSRVRHWDEVFNDELLKKYMPRPEFNDMAVLKDVVVTCPGEFDVIEGEEIIRKIVPDHKNKITDGFIVYMINDLSMTEKEREKLRKVIKTASARALWLKGYMHVVFLSEVKRLVSVNGYNPVVKDLWEDDVNILEKRIITFGSVLKSNKAFKHFSEYADAATANGDRFWVCVEDHGQKLNGLPYQQFQTLPMEDDDVRYLVNITAGQILEEVKTGKFSEFVKSKLGKAVEAYPSLLQNPIVWNLVQTTYASQRKRMAGGRMPNMVHNLFCATDPVAIFQGIFGDEPRGLLKANECTTSVFKYGIELDCTRNPHLDHAHAVRVNVAIPAWARDFYLGNGIFYSALDNIMVLHQMDFDGDHSVVTDNKVIIAAAKRGFEKYGNVPFLYDANDAHGEAGCKDYDSELRDLCRNIHAAEIGVYVNTLTKMWASGVYNREEAGFLTKAGNGNIDAFGHGEEAGNGKTNSFVADRRKQMLPTYKIFAKARLDEDKTTIILPKKMRVYRNSPVEKYSALTRFILPQDMSDIVNPKKAYEKFDQSILYCVQREKAVVIEGLISSRGGLFNQLAQATMAELNEIQRTNSIKALPGYMDMRREAVRSELEIFGSQNGASEEDIIDALIFNLFYKLERTDKLAVSLVRLFFMVYGSRVVDNIYLNTGRAVPKGRNGSKSEDTVSCEGDWLDDVYDNDDCDDYDE